VYLFINGRKKVAYICFEKLNRLLSLTKVIAERNLITHIWSNIFGRFLQVIFSCNKFSYTIHLIKKKTN